MKIAETFFFFFFSVSFSSRMASSSSLARLLHEFASTKLPHYTQLLASHVAHNSFTGHPGNIESFARLTQADLFPLSLFSPLPKQADPACRHLFLRSLTGAVAHLSGSPRDGDLPQIALVSHLDTVFPPPDNLDKLSNPFNWHEALLEINSAKPEGQSAAAEYRHIAIGPGTMDIKGGTIVLAMTLEALRACAPTHYQAVDWRLLLNAAEEVLDPSFPESAYSLGVVRRERPPLACLVFENGPLQRRTGDHLTFSMVTGRKGMGIWRIDVTGREAHAGNAHASGANAIVALANIVTRVAGLTDYARQVTINVGTMSGGTTTNTVPGQARCTLEMRAADLETYQQVRDRLTSTVREEIGGFPGCTATLTTLTEAFPWKENTGSKDLLGIWDDAAKLLGSSCVGERRGGLSDGNRFWDLCPTLDGLGPTGFNAHSASGERPKVLRKVTWRDGRDLEVLAEKPAQEYVELDSIVPKVVLNALGLHQLISAHYTSLGKPLC